MCVYSHRIHRAQNLAGDQLTWEKWESLKHEFVDEVEDFWIRQKLPSPEVLFTFKPHPPVSAFKKLLTSPNYGISSTVRRGAPPPDPNDTPPTLTLRDYQLEGVNWIMWNYYNKRSCILADEMGLGKTIQSMAFLQLLSTTPDTASRGPYLVVAPLSLIDQWYHEASTWAPDMNTILYHGTAEARKTILETEFEWHPPFVTSPDLLQRLKKAGTKKFNVVVTTYEVVIKEIALISKIKWKTLIVDEAHRLKNPNSRFNSELKTVPREFCLLLTGTPLQNSTQELWALLNFADDTNFNSLPDFLEKFGELKDANQVALLHTMLKPYLLRRVKEDVEKSLPPKDETIIKINLTPVQKKYYRAIYEKNVSFLYKGRKASNGPSLMNVAMEVS